MGNYAVREEFEGYLSTRVSDSLIAHFLMYSVIKILNSLIFYDPGLIVVRYSWHKLSTKW